MMGRRAVRACLVGVGVAVALSACQLLVGVEDEPPNPRYPKAPPPVEEASVVDPCVLARPDTEKPLTERAGPSDPGVIWFGSRVIGFAPAQGKTYDAGGREIGFDLDGVCTGDPRPNVKFDGSVSCKGLALPDGPGGIDRAAANALDGLTLPGLNVDAFDLQGLLDSGERNLLAALVGYNGGPDDREVELKILPSTGHRIPGNRVGTSCEQGKGTFLDGGANGNTPGYEEALKPSWNGCDTFDVAPGDFEVGQDGGPTSLPKARIGGFVKNYKLIVAASDATLVARFTIGSEVLNLRNPIYTGDIEPPTAERPYFRVVNGNLAGILDANELVRGIGTVLLPQAAKPVCPSATYLCECDFAVKLIAPQLCRQRDILSAGGVDPGRTCDALSTAFSLSGEQIAPPRLVTRSIGNSTCPFIADPCNTPDAGASGGDR